MGHLLSQEIAVGQSFELLHKPECLFTVVEVWRASVPVDGYMLFVRLMCVVASGTWRWRPGDVTVEAICGGTLPDPWRRVG